jgi:hypothetical protein
MLWFLSSKQRAQEVNNVLFCGKEELALAKELSYPAVVHVDYQAYACVEIVAWSGRLRKTFDTLLWPPVCSLAVFIAAHSRMIRCRRGASACLRSVFVYLFVSFSLLTHDVSKCQEAIKRASFLPVTK